MVAPLPVSDLFAAILYYNIYYANDYLNPKPNSVRREHPCPHGTRSGRTYAVGYTVGIIILFIRSDKDSRVILIYRRYNIITISHEL